MTSTPEPDERLIAAHDLARAALLEVTPASSVGEPAGYTVEDDGAVSLRFENLMSGYPGWFWTVSIARVADAEPTVLEVELLPGDGALLAPDWVPWAVRLADYQAAQVALAALDGDTDDVDDDELDGDLDDVEDLDAADFDDDGSSILHAGDVDGVDIDELDESAQDAEDDEIEELDESAQDAEDDEFEESDLGDAEPADADDPDSEG